METTLIRILHIFKMMFIVLAMIMLTVVDNKVSFIVSMLYVASTSLFVEQGIRANYQASMKDIFGSKPIS